MDRTLDGMLADLRRHNPLKYNSLSGVATLAYVSAGDDYRRKYPRPSVMGFSSVDAYNRAVVGWHSDLLDYQMSAFVRVVRSRE